MAFCINCGQKLSDGAKFCENCGKAVNNTVANQRRSVYVGVIHKCPNCGEILKSFEINCPTCGYELRGTQASSAVKEFSLKLEAIEAKREYEKSRKFFIATANMQRITKTDEQKISLIKSFAIPNTKEDMLEFMILATSNINFKALDTLDVNITKGERELNEAWLTKVHQVYEKARRIYSTDNVFTEIRNLYQGCNNRIKKTKSKNISKWALMIVGPWAFLLVVVLILVPFWGREEEKELERLNAIVVDVQNALRNNEYKHALRIADTIDYQKYEVEMERKWDLEKEYWVDKVITEAEKSGIKLYYTPSDDVDNANDESTNYTETIGFEKGFKNALDNGNKETQSNIDLFNKQMEDVQEQWDSFWVDKNDEN